MKSSEHNLHESVLTFPHYVGLGIELRSSGLTDTYAFTCWTIFPVCKTLIFFMPRKFKNVFLIVKNKLITMVPILINEGMFEPSCDLKFIIWNYN